MKPPINYLYILSIFSSFRIASLEILAPVPTSVTWLIRWLNIHSAFDCSKVIVQSKEIQ